MRWMMNYLFGIIISYILLYITIYFHEVGHALFYYRFGCKKNPFVVTVSPTLFFSTPSPIEQEKVYLLSKWKYITICYGGILSNFIIAVITSVLAFSIQSDNFYTQLIIYQLLTLNLAEIVSYMVIGNIYLVSDMAGIALNEKKLRLPNMLLGLVIMMYYIFIFTTITNKIYVLVIIYNIITILCMSVGRILFTFRNSQSQE